ncbi:type VII secretion target [Nocardia inohanensis]|uniref:type VII secretion target n=1 Tax=Nocardia inohanensis TaxID=209246 RepID=UPI00082DC0BE|nr:type VII secretion target [Nocardia inohanensis]
MLKADYLQIANYGTEHGTIAANVAGAAAADSVGAMAQAVPVFGLIGQDFLVAFALAQGNYLSSSAEIAAVHAKTAVSAYSAVGVYEGAETTSSVNLLKSVLSSL